MSARVVFACDRSGCEETVVIELEDERDAARCRVAEVVPDGWGWDVSGSGLDFVVHCPEHRSKGGG